MTTKGTKDDADAGKSNKTLLNERLPSPRASTSSSSAAGSPRARVQRRSAVLKQVALAGAAGSVSACIGFGVVDPLPEPVVCSADQDPRIWLTAFASGGLEQPITVTVQLQRFNVDGLQFTNQFAAIGAALSGTTFDGTSPAASTTATMTLVPEDGVDEIRAFVGVSCDDDPPRTLQLTFTRTAVEAGDGTVTVSDLPPPP